MISALLPMIHFLVAMTLLRQAEPYMEPMRPQFHFTAAKGWLNDPNGLVYFKGSYHMFFQHNPFGTQWGNMTWGHAISRDLVHWKQLPEAIEPDVLGTIFSGSAVVDTRNTARLGAGALICVYTAAGGTSDLSKGQPFTQCLAYSLDGKTFAKHIGNPVLDHLEAENRDPKVIWYEPTRRWVLALYLNGDRYGLFTSPNLRAWSQIDTVVLPGASECPDFFELPVDGDRRNTKWVFWGANGNYLTGTFDGRKFKPEGDPIRSNFGNTFYAAQTYFNDPKGRRVQIGWFRGAEFPGMPWNQQMSFPTELRLISTKQGPRLTFRPVDEIKLLHAGRVTPNHGKYVALSGLMDVSARIALPGSGLITLNLNGQPITYDIGANELKALGIGAPVEPMKGELELRILIDRGSIEIFAQGGSIYLPLNIPSTARDAEFSIPDSVSAKVDAFELKSSWTRKP